MSDVRLALECETTILELYRILDFSTPYSRIFKASKNLYNKVSKDTFEESDPLFLSSQQVSIRVLLKLPKKANDP